MEKHQCSPKTLYSFYLSYIYSTHTQWKNSLVKDAVIMKITVSRIITISSLVSSILS